MLIMYFEDKIQKYNKETLEEIIALYSKIETIGCFDWKAFKKSENPIISLHVDFRIFITIQGIPELQECFNTLAERYGIRLKWQLQSGLPHIKLIKLPFNPEEADPEEEDKD